MSAYVHNNTAYLVDDYNMAVSKMRASAPLGTLGPALMWTGCRRGAIDTKPPTSAELRLIADILDRESARLSK